jgi:hypothetical protein
MGGMTGGAGKTVVDVARVLTEAGIRQHLLKVVTLAAQRVWSINGHIRVGEEAVQQASGNGCHAELVSALKDVAEPGSVRPIRPGAAEFSVVIAVVTIRAKDAHANGSRGVCPIEVQHLSAQAGLSQRALSVVHHRMTGSGRPVKFGNQVQGITTSDNPYRKISVFGSICDLTGTRTVTTQAVLVLIERWVEHGDAVGGADTGYPILRGPEQRRCAQQ